MLNLTRSMRYFSHSKSAHFSPFCCHFFHNNLLAEFLVFHFAVLIIQTQIVTNIAHENSSQQLKKKRQQKKSHRKIMHLYGGILHAKTLLNIFGQPLIDPAEYYTQTLKTMLMNTYLSKLRRRSKETRKKSR